MYIHYVYILLCRSRAGGSNVGALASALEAKYTGASAQGTTGFEEPSEEEFSAAAARVKEKQGSAPGNKENGRGKKKRKIAKQ
jgi:hypothetical protein